MRFTDTPIAGAFSIDVELHGDVRGYFARAWCLDELRDKQIEASFVQANVGHTNQKGTVRGLHYQLPPHEEAKLIRCTQGSIFDVIVDLRPHSSTYGTCFGIELTAENKRSMWVPAGCAHGYQALADHTEVYYLVTSYYAPEAERGVRYDDPSLLIDWPIKVSDVSSKDRNWPDLVLDVTHGNATVVDMGSD